MAVRYRRGSGRALVAAALAAGALLSCDALAAGGGDANAYRVGAVPAWVDVIAPDYAAPPPEGDRKVSTYHVLLDNQLDVRRRGHAQFRRSAIRLVNDAGAEEYSQVSLYADPGYEQVTLHWVRVVRDGKLSDRLAATKITVLPVESDLQLRIYSGLESINLLIPDLRAGDVLDYAYTLDSVSPNFPEHFATELSIAWSEPVLRQHLRLRHFPDDPVQFRVHGGTAEPVVHEREGRRELEFDWRDLPAKAGEDDMPDWYPHWATIEFSDMTDWHVLAARTAAMYRDQSALGPRTRSEIEKLKALPGGDADRVLAALRMTQDGIRYASISIGPGSYRPHPSDVVLERNFGDCKDKSLLLVNLLRAIGVDARVALVNTETGHVLPEALPSPRAFDHAIVRARVGPDVFWLDPTATLQGGTLAKTDQADFEYALVIDPETTALERMPRARADASSRDVQLTFNLTAGLEKPATLEVRTRFEGRAADSLRSDIADRNVEERTTDYLNYYASYYPGIQSVAPIAVEDDPVANVIVTRERYRLERGFRERAGKELVFEIFPDEMYGFAKATGTSKRTAPLAQAYPARVTQRFEVRLPEGWPIRPSKFVVDNPAFRYESHREYAKNVLKMAFEFEGRADVVPIERVPRYLADQKRMDDDLGYELTYRKDAGQGASGIATYPLAVALLGLLAGLWIAIRWIPGYDPAPRPLPAGAAAAPEGIGGWLLLVALNVIATVGVDLVLGGAMIRMSVIDVWEGLPASAAPQFAAFAQHGVAAMLFLACLLLPCHVAIAVAFFTRRSSAPKLVIASLWLTGLFGFAVEAVVNRLAPDEADATGFIENGMEIFLTAVWTGYLVLSWRVANTFVRRRVSQVRPAASGGPPIAALPPGPA